MNRIPKEFAPLVKDAVAKGQVTLEQGARHLCARRADGSKQIIPGSPSDHRALANFKAQFRKFVAGLPDTRQARRMTAMAGAH
ncbi:hypothetical protein ACOTHJ_12550 [Achromobacter xylosoxidans]